MLVGAYPFEDSSDPRNFRKTIQVSMLAMLIKCGAALLSLIASLVCKSACTCLQTDSQQQPLCTLALPHLQRIMAVKYSFPPGLVISPECADLLARIFVASPQQRITIPQIRAHPWFRINLPAELAVSCGRG
jgi:serine/threonine-protein kinase SRK2